MLLSARLLDNFSSINNFDYANHIDWTEGDTVTLYLQLIDLSKDKATDGFKPGGRRYIPTGTATLSVVLESIDSAKEVTRSATQDANDKSIWHIHILATDTIRGTSNIKLTLVEGTPAVTTRGSVAAAVQIYPANSCKSI
jgi:hypothetical protein